MAESINILLSSIDAALLDFAHEIIKRNYKEKTTGDGKTVKLVMISIYIVLPSTAHSADADEY